MKLLRHDLPGQALSTLRELKAGGVTFAGAPGGSGSEGDVMTVSEDLQWAVDGPPIGVWTTVLGTADVLMQDTLSLRPNGSGTLETGSIMRGAASYQVEWKHHQPGVLSIRMQFPDDAPDEEPSWDSIRYCSATIAIDAGGTKVQVLRNLHDERFWHLHGPVCHVSASA